MFISATLPFLGPFLKLSSPVQYFIVAHVLAKYPFFAKECSMTFRMGFIFHDVPIFTFIRVQLPAHQPCLTSLLEYLCARSTGWTSGQLTSRYLVL